MDNYIIQNAIMVANLKKNISFYHLLCGDTQSLLKKSFVLKPLNYIITLLKQLIISVLRLYHRNITSPIVMQINAKDRHVMFHGQNVIRCKIEM